MGRATMQSGPDKKSRRQEHFLHALSKDIVEKCANRGVGTIAVGHLKSIRDDKDWERHGNKRLHDWGFETLLSHIEYNCFCRNWFIV